MIKKPLCLLLIITVCASLFTACGSEKQEKITDAVSIASRVLINGEVSDTVEASLGAFQGKQGDYIEFIFSEPQEINTIHIIEKTTTVRQFNIYAEVDEKYKLIYTGKNILNENIAVERTTATALKLEILNTQIGDDNFIIQGVSAYNIKEETPDVN